MARFQGFSAFLCFSFAIVLCVIHFLLSLRFEHLSGKQNKKMKSPSYLLSRPYFILHAGRHTMTHEGMQMIHEYKSITDTKFILNQGVVGLCCLMWHHVSRSRGLHLVSCMTVYFVSLLANHQSRHQATSKMGCQPGDCKWQLNLPLRY